MYWEPELEQLERKDLEGLQLKRLNGTLRQAARSPYYGRSKEVGRLVQSGVSSVEQIRQCVRVAHELGREVANGKEARAIYRIGVQYDSIEETLKANGMAPNRVPGQLGVPQR